MDIIICDDQPLYRQGLAAVAVELQPGVQVTEIASGEEFAQIGVAPENVALVVVNAAMIDGTPALAVGELRQRFPGAAVVLVAASARRAEANGFVADGAAGVMLRSDPPARILTGLRHVMAGGLLLPAEIFRDARAPKAPPAASDPKEESAPIQIADFPGEWNLTRRQATVLSLMGRGWPNRRIADELRVSEGTIKVHVNAILKVLKVRNRTQAALQLNQRGPSGSGRRR
jgi:DNA-binding NarL/FixJ family response regulator